MIAVVGVIFAVTFFGGMRVEERGGAGGVRLGDMAKDEKHEGDSIEKSFGCSHATVRNNNEMYSVHANWMKTVRESGTLFIFFLFLLSYLIKNNHGK